MKVGFAKLNNFRKPILVLVVVLVTVISFGQFFSYAAEEDEAPAFEKKRVLFISSYASSFTTYFQQIEGIREAFSGYPIQIDIEAMDTKRFYTEENIENFYTSLKYKIENLPVYDGIIVADDNGLNFVMENRDELFSNVPIVFMGINNKDNALKYSEDPLITGVHEAASIGDTIELALDLNPEASKVVAIADNTTSGHADLELFYDEQSRFGDVEFTEINARSLNYEHVSEELAALDESSVIVLLSLLRDADEVSMDFYDSVELIVSSTSLPVFHPYYHGVGDGLIGGRVISHKVQGSTAGNMMVDVFLGTPIEDIQMIENSPNQYVLDYKLLDQYELNLKRLPEGVVFLNRDVSFFEEYFTYIVVILFFLIMQMIIIVVMYRNILFRRRTQEELQIKQLELIEAYANLESSNEELETTNEELSYINKELEDSIQQIDIRDQQIHDLVYLDPLTKLSNRFSISGIIDEMLMDRETKSLAIVFLDVDNFKNINDTFGHEIGDKVIEKTGARLQKSERDDIRLGRFGGDEFLIVLKNKSVHELESLLIRISETFKDSVVLEKNKFFLTVSMGVSLYPEHGNTQEELIKKADIALYEAKNRGKNRYMIFKDKMNESIADKLNFQNKIKEGFKNNEFYLNFQPIYLGEEKQVVGFEALLRWYNEELGQVSPYNVVTEAEEMGLIVEIGEFVFREACQFSKKVSVNREKPYYISVNISAVQLMYNGFYEQITSIIEEYGIDPGHICLEMTETVLIEDINSTMHVVEKLKKYGFLIGLDDFGTGYSSLNYLRNFSIDLLKIDKSFIDTITQSSYDLYLVQAVVKIASQREIKVVAEGVESKEQLDAIIEVGCRAVQGYYFSKPLSIQDSLALVSEYKTK